MTNTVEIGPPRSEPNSDLLDALEVLYARSADRKGSGIPSSQRLMLWPRIYLRSTLASSPLKSAGNKDSIRESLMVTILVPTPVSVLCRNCHLIWRNISEPAYVDWAYHFAILARMQNLWAHASTLVCIHASSSSLGPK